MNRKRWFAALKRGIGWKPATWQGWLITTVYWTIIVWDFLRLYDVSHSWKYIVINFLPEALVLTVILAFICYFTGEKPRT